MPEKVGTFFFCHKTHAALSLVVVIGVAETGNRKRSHEEKWAAHEELVLGWATVNEPRKQVGEWKGSHRVVPLQRSTDRQGLSPPTEVGTSTRSLPGALDWSC